MSVLSLTPIQILRGSTMDPYILNKRLNDPYDGGNIRAADGSFIQTLDEYLANFKPDENIKMDFEGDRTDNERYDVDFRVDEQARIIYLEKVKHRCIATIEHGIALYKKHLDDRVTKLYLPALESGGIPNDASYKRQAEELRFEDEGRLERFFTKALKKAIEFVEKTPKNDALFKLVESIEPEKLNELLKGLSEEDKRVLKTGILENLKNAQLRIEELYKSAIEQGSIPDSPSYNQRITELGIQSMDDLREKLFYFLRNALCLTNWNDDAVLRTDERAFRSCLD